MMFEDGTREPLHGHNYRVRIKGDHSNLKGDVVMDFLHIKPIIRKVCDSFDHQLLIPGESPHLSTIIEENNTIIKTKDSLFSIPSQDVKIMPVSNSSVEVMAKYITELILNKIKEEYNFEFQRFELELEETPGQCAVYVFEN